MAHQLEAAGVKLAAEIAAAACAVLCIGAALVVVMLSFERSARRKW